MKNKYVLKGDYYEIYLNSEKYPGIITIIDKEDFDKVKDYSWCPKFKRKHSFYAITTINGEFVNVEKLIKPTDKILDHINHNTLDNRKINLRECTTQQNNMNKSPIKNSSSIYKGVIDIRGKYRAQITFNKKYFWLGNYDDEIYAAKVYDRAAIKLFGRWACLNFPFNFDNTAMIDIERFFVDREYASPHTGVTWDLNKEKWQSRAYHNKKTVHLGRFVTEIAAAKAYNSYVIKNGLNKKLNDV